MWGIDESETFQKRREMFEKRVNPIRRSMWDTKRRKEELKRGMNKSFKEAGGWMTASPDGLPKGGTIHSEGKVWFGPYPLHRAKTCLLTFKMDSSGKVYRSERITKKEWYD